MKSREQKGFTLLEMIVAVSVFGIIAISAVSGLLSLTSSQKKAAALQNAQDNVRFALESMAKEIRTGSNFFNQCGSVPCDRFQFLNSKRVGVMYYLDSGVIQKCSDFPSCSLGGPITASEIDITNLDFYISGESIGDNLQPRVTIVIRALAGKEFAKERSELKVQTTVSQRETDS